MCARVFTFFYIVLTCIPSPVTCKVASSEISMFGGFFFFAGCNLGILYAYVYHFINSRTFIKPECLNITCLNIIVSHSHVKNSCNFVLKTQVIEYLIKYAICTTN